MFSFLSPIGGPQHYHARDAVELRQSILKVLDILRTLACGDVSCNLRKIHEQILHASGELQILQNPPHCRREEQCTENKKTY